MDLAQVNDYQQILRIRAHNQPQRVIMANQFNAYSIRDSIRQRQGKSIIVLHGEYFVPLSLSTIQSEILTINGKLQNYERYLPDHLFYFQNDNRV